MGSQILQLPTTRRRSALLAHLAPPVAGMTYQPQRHPPLVLSLGSPSVRQPADILFFALPPPSPPVVVILFVICNGYIFFNVVPATFHLISRSFSLLVVLWRSLRSGFTFITACGDLTGGLQDTNYPRWTETLKMDKVCLAPLLVLVFLSMFIAF